MSSTVQGQIYRSLRSANLARQSAWCPEQQPDLSFRGNELAGEVGEAQDVALAVLNLGIASGRASNVIKKLERERQGWRGSRDTKEHLAEELADVVICADLIGIAAGIDLDAAVVSKFNSTSEQVGLPHRLASSVLGGNENHAESQGSPKSDSLTSTPSSSTREGAETLRDETLPAPKASNETPQKTQI